jgi:hypothetical protein
MIRRLLLAGAIAAAAVPASAQRLDLSVNPTTVSFPLADPDTMPLVLSPPVEIRYRVRQYQGPWTLTIVAMGDLIAGPSRVDISNVTWVATPAPPFQSGTLSKTVAQRLASGTGPTNPARDGQITFRLANSWNYDAGLYTQTILLTLSAP